MTVNPCVFEQSQSWPFREARRLIEYLKIKPKDKVIFSTGYGPSGLPHLGTFGEVLRTTMVRHAFACLSAQPSELICVSDDMDGLRKVPGNVPEKEKLAQYLNFPLTQVPDPFGDHASFGEHNNKRLCRFLDSFGFNYRFLSATQAYQSGLFDTGLCQALDRWEEILDLLLPTLREERRKTYSPFLPISPQTGRVLQVAMDAYLPEEKSIVFKDEDGTLTKLPVTGGHCKLQWKVDWGMRWFVLGVDYEMCGKDLIDSVTIASKVCKILGGTPPVNLVFEHFLDDQGRKISKSVGNGLTMEEWLCYAPLESLSYFMYTNPQRAKRLFLGTIPKSVDEYISLLGAYPNQTPEQQVDNPVWHVHQGTPPSLSCPVSFSMLLNLTSVCHAPTKESLWAYISRYAPEACPQTHPYLDQLVGHALKYYKDIVEPQKRYRLPSDLEKQALQALRDNIQEKLVSPDPVKADEWQHIIHETGKACSFPDPKQWFSCLYEVLLGQESGPRMGTFIALYGPANMCALIDQSLKRKEP